MEDFLHPEEPQEISLHPRRKRVMGTIIFIGVLALFVVFSVKVFGYYRKIQNGTLDVSTLSFSTTAATGSALAAIARSAPGNGELATTDDPSLGNKNAKLTIVEFADFGCPYSREVSYIVRAIAKQFPNDVQFIYRDFPLTDLHPGADLAAMAGECAQDQGKFWEMHDALYRHNGELTAEEIYGIADKAGLNLNTFDACFTSGEYAEEVSTDLADGVAAGVVGTPTFFLNGEMVEGSIPYTIFTELVAAFLTTP